MSDTLLPSIVEIPSLIREVFFPPPCPEEVAVLLDAALTYHNSANFELSVRSYIEAQHKWEFLRGWANVPEAAKERFPILPDAEREAFLRNELVPVPISAEAEAYLRLCIGSVFESAGRDERALAEYLAAARLAEALRPDHPTHATVASCLGGVYANLTRFDIAGDYFIRCLDIREKLLGARHVDTAAALHNVAVVLHRMGRYSQALAFYRKAESIFGLQLQAGHPRCMLVQRNMEKCHSRIHIAMPSQPPGRATVPSLVTENIAAHPVVMKKGKAKKK